MTEKLNILLNEASNLLSEKDYKEALKIYEQVLELDATNLEALKNAGISSFAVGNNDKALGYFQKLISIEPDDAVARYYIGSIYSLDNNFEAAINEFKHVISLRAEYIDAYRSLAMIYINLGNNKLAIEILEEAFSRDGNDVQTIKLLSTAYMNDSQDGKSRELLEKAVADGFEDADIYNLLGSSSVMQGQQGLAIEYFEKTLQLKPEDYNALVSLALLYGLNSEFDKSIELHKKALRIFPANYELQINSAIDFYSNGYLEYSRELMEEILEIDPNEVRAIYQIALIYQEECDYEKALKYLIKAAAITSNSDVISLKIASVYADMGKFDEAYRIMEKLIRKNPTSPNYYYEYALISVKAKDSVNAEKYFKKVITLKGDDAVARKDLAVLYLSSRQLDLAKEEFEKAHALAPNDPWICFEYANYLFLDGKYQQALDMYNKAISINPDAIEYYVAKAVLMNELKQFDEAIKILEPVVQRKNKHPKVLHALALAYFMKDDLIAAKNVLEQYIAQGRSGSDLLNLYALVLDKLGDYSNALKITDMLLEQSPNNIVLMTNKARYLSMLGETEKSEDLYLTVLSALPEYEDAIVGLLGMYKEHGLLHKAKDFVKKINAENFSDSAKDLIKSFE